MPREIKTSLIVDGEAAFKRAINEANTSMRNLGTQLTLAQANFKKDGDAMKLMEARSKALNAEVGQQEEIVKALRQAVEESTKAFGENSTKTEKWQAELNRAEARLANLQNELSLNEAGLDRNGKAFDEGAQKAADYGATLKDIGKNLSLETISKGVEGITQTVEGAISKVIELGTKVTEAMREAAQWADDLITESMINGMSIEDQQRMEYASELVDTSVDTIMTARDRIAKKMVGGWKDGDIDMWDMLGISLKDSEDNYRSSLDILFELGETLKSVEKIDGNDIRADAWAMEVLGRSYKDLKPLFEAGADTFYSKMAEAPIVSEENVRRLGEMNDKFDEFDSRLNTLKYTALSELAPALEGIVDSLNKMLDEFNGWMETDEGKQAMSELSEAIKELFSGISDIKFSDVINSVKNAITALRDGLEWLANHKGTVYDALKYIAAGFALLKISEGVLTFLKLKAGWNLAFGGKGGGGSDIKGGSPTGLGKGDGSGTGGGGGGGLAALLSGSKIARAIGNTASSVTAADPTGALALLPQVLGDWTTFGRRLRNGGSLEEAATASVDTIKASAKQGLGNFTSYFTETLPKAIWGVMGVTSAEDLGKKIESAQFDMQAGAEDMQRRLFGGGEEHQYNITEEDLIRQIIGPGYRMGSGLTRDEMEPTIPEGATILQDDGRALEEIRSGAEDLNGATSTLEDAASQLRSNTEAAKAVTEKVAGVDLKTFNGLPPQIRAAVAAGASSGVSGIRVQLDGAAVGRLVAPYVSQYMGTAVGR